MNSFQRSKIFILAAVFLIAAYGIASEEKPAVTAQTTPAVSPEPDHKGSCLNDPNLAGKCFTFKGRALYGANLTSLKIYMVGVPRIVADRGEVPMPQNLIDIFSGDIGAEVYGEFTVCPLTRYKKGVMQFICIDSVKITRVVNSKQQTQP